MEPESDYNILLCEEDWDMLMDSVKNPKYNGKLANLLRQPLIFEE